MKRCAWFTAAILCALPAEAQMRPSAYRIETVAGSSQDGDGGLATAAQLSKIQGVAVDRTGNIYVSDTDRHRVRRVSPSGIVTTIAGNGTAGYSGDGGPASQARLNLPYGLAADGAGNLYIADLGNNRVRRVWPDGVITTVAPGVSFATPRNLALDAAGNLYVSEFDGHRVRRIAPDGSVTIVAGTGVAGFSGDGGPPAQAQLAYPAGLAIDRGGALLIADSGNNRIRRIFATGVINTILGGSSATALATPSAVAVDPQGIIYAGDSSPVVRSLTLNGRWSDVAGGVSSGFSGDGGPASAAALTAVLDLQVDASGNLYIADGARVRRVNAAGNIATLAGDGYLHSIGDGASALDALLSRPAAIALDSSGVLRIADSGTQRVRQVASGVISTLTGNGTTAQLNQPMGVAAAAGGTVYIADTANSAIRVVGADRVVRTLGAALRLPRGVCLNHAGVLHVVDTGNGRILRVGASTDVIAAQLNAPEACAFDAAGNLYLAETGAHRVRRLSPAGEWSSVAGTGVAGSDGDEGPAAAARISFPRGVAVDDSGGIFIADTAGNRIRLVTPDGVIHTIAGTGAAGFSGDSSDALTALLNGPAGLALDGAGGVYFADSLNDRVRRLLPVSAALVMVAPAAVTNALSGAAGPVAPGELVRLSGTSFGGDTACEVWFGVLQAPLLASTAGQVTVRVPLELAGATAARVEIRVGGAAVAAADLDVGPSAPGLLPLVFNQDGSLNSPSTPAAWGDALSFFATGAGLLDSGNGSPVLPAAAFVGGLPADVVHTAELSGAPGVLLVQVRVPGGFIPSGQVPLLFTVGATPAPPVEVWLR